MASIKIILRDKPTKEGLYPVVLRVIKNRKSKLISLGLECIKKDWDEDNNQFKKTQANHVQRNRLLLKHKDRALKIIDDFFMDEQDFTLEQFEEKFRGIEPNKLTVIEFWDEVISDLKKSGKVGNAKALNETKNSLFSFHKKTNLMFKEITPGFLEKYEVYLRENNNSDGGVAFKMRELRSIYNKALIKKVVDEKYYPFKVYKISKLKVGNIKKALSRDEIRLIENIDDDSDTNRDIFKRLQEQLPKRSYTEPMNKVIESLYSLNTKKKINSVYNSLIEKMSRLMGGEITISSLESIAPIQFSFKFDESKDLPMYLASSSVNQLTILYLYLKYWAKEKNNFLMIDEPEVNLHPENQIRLMDILVQFVTEHDNRVLITTHSPILTDILNNYVYLHTLKSYDVDVTKIIEDNQLKNLNPEISIAKEDLGVYFFTGDKIIDYGTSQYGVYFRNFTEVINSVQKSGEILTNHIYLAENE